METSICNCGNDGALETSPEHSLHMYHCLPPSQHPCGFNFNKNIPLSRTQNDLLTVIVKNADTVTNTDTKRGSSDIRLDIPFETNCCQPRTSISNEDDISALDFNSTSSYATLTPLQSLPPISTMSEKFIFGGHINGSCVIDTSCCNDSCSDNVENSSPIDSTVRVSSYVATKTMHNTQRRHQQQTVENYNYQRHQSSLNSVHLNELVESSFSETEKHSTPSENQQCNQSSVMSAVLTSYELNRSVISQPGIRKSDTNNITLASQMRQVACMSSAHKNDDDVMEDETLIQDLESTFNSQKRKDLVSNINIHYNLQYSNLAHDQEDDQERTNCSPNPPSESYSDFSRERISSPQKFETEPLPCQRIDNNVSLAEVSKLASHVSMSSSLEKKNVNIALVDCPYRKESLRDTYKHQLNLNYAYSSQPITSEHPKGEISGHHWVQKPLRKNKFAEECDSVQPSKEIEEINTKELAQRISSELKRYSIPQAIFAQRVLCRSQGTLSDLLRNPKPWSKLKSGRETFRRMLKWLQEPEYHRMSTLRNAAAQIPQRSGSVVNSKLESNDVRGKDRHLKIGYKTNIFIPRCY